MDSYFRPWPRLVEAGAVHGSHFRVRPLPHPTRRTFCSSFWMRLPTSAYFPPVYYYRVVARGSGPFLGLAPLHRKFLAIQEKGDGAQCFPRCEKPQCRAEVQIGSRRNTPFEQSVRCRNPQQPLVAVRNLLPRLWTAAINNPGSARY